jgi:hypothetical protein
MTLVTRAGKGEELTYEELDGNWAHFAAIAQAASASAPAAVVLAEDTDNGTNTVTLTVPATLSASYTLTFPAETGTLQTVAGGKVLPIAAISDAHTFALGEQGGRHPAADTTARTWTIPANASVAFPVGTVLTIINEFAAGAITLAITSDTLTWLDDGDTGSRTIAEGGVATVLKTGSTAWLVYGKGIS